MPIFRKVVLLAVVLLAGTAAEAGATIRIENQNDPAGDPTPTRYSVTSAAWSEPFPFSLTGGDYRSLGVNPGTYTVQALPAAGWAVGDIQCVGPRSTDFMIDVPNGRVTVTHGPGEEHICAFTNRKASQGGGQYPGVSPNLTPAELRKVVVPRHPALLGVTAGHGFAKATVRLTRRSVIKARLLRRGKRVGAKRIVRKAGTHVIRVALERKRMRRMQRRGLEHVTLTLRITVTATRSGATHVFKHRVRVAL